MQRHLAPRINRSFDEETYDQLKETVEHNGVFQVNPRRTKLGDDKFKILKPGDHVTCRRWYIIYHHAIVVNVNELEKRIEVIHYTTVKGTRKKIQIKREWLFGDQLRGDWYRIDYPKQVTDNNNTDIVLQRAEARVDEADYKFLNNNCESFATFCKTGRSHCIQTDWFELKINEVRVVNWFRSVAEFLKAIGALWKLITNVLAKANATVAIAEWLEEICEASNFIGAGLVIAAEARFMTLDIRKMYSKRTGGDISREVFTEMAIQRITEAVCASVGSIGVGYGFEIGGGFIGGIIGSAVPGIGTVVGVMIGALIGSILGGILGSVVGRLLGSLLGPQIAKLTTKFMRDDIALKTIKDIHPGDHIIMYASFFHRRCHAIVVNVTISKKIRVIRNKFRRGVVDETMEFKNPVYKALYTEGTIHSPDVVVLRAKSKIGQNEYSFFTNDCKKFARWCKEK